MPSLDVYKRIHNGGVYTNGNVRKNQSDNIIQATWWEDLTARVGYFYDLNHDTHRTQLNDLVPQLDDYKIPMDIKFIPHTSQTYSKDNITYHLQLRPGQKCVVEYYDECFAKRYGATYPIGLYCDIQDEQGVWNRWIVVAKANYDNVIFPTYELLRCDSVIPLMMNHQKHYFPVVLRSQNSYNSGLWTDQVIAVTEDQQKFIVPLDRETEQIYYNQRVIIDVNVLTEPRAWQVSKVNRVASPGVAMITLAQNRFDANHDVAEYDSDGNVIAWWADYNLERPLDEPIDEPPVNYTGEITCSARKEIKSGGSYKKFMLQFTDVDGNKIAVPSGSWDINIDGADASALVDTIVDIDSIKVKFIGGDQYIGKILNINYITDDQYMVSSNIQIIGL